jgi:hypothetical protein
MSTDLTDEDLALVKEEADKPKRKPFKPPSPQALLIIARALSTKPDWWAGRPFPRDRAERREFLRLMRKAAKEAKKAGRGKRGAG